MKPLLAPHTATQFRSQQPIRSLALWLCLLSFAGISLSLQAQSISASAQVSGQAGSGNNFDYVITLDNSSSSSSSIGTFWYAWAPGQDYLPTSPTLVTPPSGWTDSITHFGSSDGYGIEFLANGPANAVAPGHTLTFSFESMDTPSALAGNSPHYSGIPVGTSYVYNGAPFSSPSATFDVQSVPEPSMIGLTVLGAILILAAKRSRISGLSASRQT